MCAAPADDWFSMRCLGSCGGNLCERRLIVGASTKRTAGAAAQSQSPSEIRDRNTKTLAMTPLPHTGRRCLH